MRNSFNLVNFPFIQEPKFKRTSPRRFNQTSKSFYNVKRPKQLYRHKAIKIIQDMLQSTDPVSKVLPVSLKVIKKTQYLKNKEEKFTSKSP